MAPAQQTQGHLIVITPGRIGTAVERNTIRRRIKALFHEEKLLENGFDYVVIAKKAGPKLTFQTLKKIILGAIPNASTRLDGAS